jgi:hypothetical protein
VDERSVANPIAPVVHEPATAFVARDRPAPAIGAIEASPLRS